MTIGENIRKFRQKQGLTQTDLGVMVGVNCNSISAYERGINIPGVFNLLSIADALNVSLDELVGRKF